MAMLTDRQRLSRQYSTTNLWIGLIVTLLLLAILLESVCLGILYVTDSRKGFAETHLLTRHFVATPPNAVPGKKFLDTLRTGGGEWAQFNVADGLLGWRLAAKISAFHEPRPDTKYTSPTIMALSPMWMILR